MRAKLTRPISSSLREFQHGAFAIKTIRARPMKTPALQASDQAIFFLVLVLLPDSVQWRKVTQDLRNGGPLKKLTIAKLIKIKVLLHQFSNLMFNLHYVCLNFASKVYK